MNWAWLMHPFPNWEWDAVNILGICAIALEGFALTWFACWISKKKRVSSHIFGNQNEENSEYSPEGKQRNPKCPHWPVPVTMKSVTQNITEDKASHNCNKILHSLAIRILHRRNRSSNRD